MVDQSQWKLNHTMLRIKDPKRSLEFYKLLGLSEVNKLEFPDNKFDLYFLGEQIKPMREKRMLTCETSIRWSKIRINRQSLD